MKVRVLAMDKDGKLLYEGTLELPIIVGRGLKNYVFLKTKAQEVPLAKSLCVSRRHLEISAERGKVVVRDLGSTNGTTVNGEPLRGEKEIHEKAEIVIPGKLPAGRPCNVIRLVIEPHTVNREALKVMLKDIEASTTMLGLVRIANELKDKLMEWGLEEEAREVERILRNYSKGPSPIALKRALSDFLISLL